MKVLIVDDAKSNVMLISAIIQRAGHQVVTAATGEEAVEQFRDRSPDLVLMDVNLPGIDGYEATRQIRAIGGEGWIPVIFLSGSDQSVDIVRGIEAGGDDYLTKPIDAMILTAKFRAMQRIAEMRQQLISVSNQLRSSNEELDRLASLDGLTGIPNRRLFDTRLMANLVQHAKDGSPLALILGDVDYFKLYNDSLGHQWGDDCLRKVAEAISGALWDERHLAARYGGEEFVVLLPDTTVDHAVAIAEEIRAALEGLKLGHPKSAVSPYVTLSLGVAGLARGEPTPVADVFLGRADKALYRAKEGGRNRVTT